MLSSISGREGRPVDELLKQFLVEGPELVQQASEDLMALERSPGDATLVDSAFRAIHTLKGSVGLFDLGPMSETLHAAEDLLGALRDGGVGQTSQLIDSLLACVAQTERWLDTLAEAGELPPDAPEVGERLTRRLRADLAGAGAAVAPASVSIADMSWAAALMERHGIRAEAPLVAVRYRPDPQSYFNGDDPLAVVRGVPGLTAVDVETPPGDPAAYDPFVCALSFDLLSTAPIDAVRAALRFVPDQARIVVVEPSAAVRPDAAGRSLRVDAARIDQLVDLVDELMVAKNALAAVAAIAQAGADIGDVVSRLRESQVTLDRIAGGLHRAVMAVRMTPVGPVLRRMPRLVREAAAALGKTVDLIVEGHDVEADKAIVDGLFEPLLHILRNAVDHGVELPQGRAKAGKPARATVILRARQQADRVVIEVSDDGRGFDPAAIRAAAVRKGLLSRDAAALLDDAQSLDLIFLPGFSTAETVSELSGRGVGMDAVRAAVGRLGGHVLLSGAPGQGASVTLSLPLTLVMSRIVLVEAGGERFGVPMEDLVETVQLAGDRIVPVRHGRAFVLRDQATPLLDLADLLHLPRKDALNDHRKVLVVRSRGEPVGVAVEAIDQRMEVALRPMAGLLAQAPGLLGTTLMGDGQVLMVLDLPELIG
jgi:two-component system chemotaxis sensor kinase CheA